MLHKNRALSLDVESQVKSLDFQHPMKVLYFCVAYLPSAALLKFVYDIGS